MTQEHRATMLFGALVADAAALGVHWIYDPARLDDIAAQRGGVTAFTPVDPAHYEGVPSYFAHAARGPGALTQYGTNLRLAIDSLIASSGKFDPAAFQAAFVENFGPGGSYSGYIDRPTRGALERIAVGHAPSGIDDDQLPAVSRLPAMIAAGAPDIRAMMEATNVNIVAEQYSDVFADVLTQVIAGTAVPGALRSAAQHAHADIRDGLLAALNSTDRSSTVFAGQAGRACHLPMAGPVLFHILRDAKSFEEAVERNNRAGGDNAGRAIILGAVMGAAHGVASEAGIPLAWSLQLAEGAALWASCQTLCALAQ